MRSRISIDLDESNNPIIKIEHVQSDDLRDKTVKRFLEGVNSTDGSFLSLYYQPLPPNSEKRTAILRPCALNEVTDWMNKSRFTISSESSSSSVKIEGVKINK